MRRQYVKNKPYKSPIDRSNKMKRKAFDLARKKIFTELNIHRPVSKRSWMLGRMWQLAGRVFSGQPCPPPPQNTFHFIKKTKWKNFQYLVNIRVNIHGSPHHVFFLKISYFFLYFFNIFFSNFECAVVWLFFPKNASQGERANVPNPWR